MGMRPTVRALFDNIDTLTADEIASSATLKDLIAKNLPNGIAKSHRAGHSRVSIFEINSTEVYVEIEKPQWIPALQTVISWYSDEKVQDYEKCVELSKLIEEVKKPIQKTKQSGKTGIQSSKRSSGQNIERKDSDKKKEQE